VATVSIRSCDEFEGGFGWIVESEFMERCSHALVTDGRVWLIDPLDGDGVDDRVRAAGDPAGVIQLLDRHNRDCAALADRLDVPHLRLPEAVPGSPFTVVPVIKLPRWHEVALWWPERRALVIAELIGTNHVYRLGEGPAGMHPMMRALAPGVLRAYQPEHLLVGHGRGVHGPLAAAAVQDAYDRSRKDLPKLALKLPAMVKAAIATRR
jgi:hypothetical protein